MKKYKLVQNIRNFKFCYFIFCTIICFIVLSVPTFAKENSDNAVSYTHLDVYKRQGIDKILKKVGEEATEIVIAAKNPDPEEVKYEISDFLYHIMVLMAEKGVTWEEITEELANR